MIRPGRRGRHRNDSEFEPDEIPVESPGDFRRRAMDLCENRLEEIPGDVGQAEVAAVEAVGQLRVVEAHQVQDRGVDVVDVDSVLDGLVAELVGGSVLDAALDAAAGHPGGEGVRVVVAARATLASRTCGRTRRPRSRACRSSMPRGFQVGQQRGGRLIDGRRAGAVIAVDVVVAVPGHVAHRRRRGVFGHAAKICTKRTPRSTSRRAIRHCRPIVCRLVAVQAVQLLRVLRFLRRVERFRGGGLHAIGQFERLDAGRPGRASSGRAAGVLAGSAA